jgi:hypothetical protein
MRAPDGPATEKGTDMTTIIPVVAIWIAITITLAIAGMVAATAED